MMGNDIPQFDYADPNAGDPEAEARTAASAPADTSSPQSQQSNQNNFLDYFKAVQSAMNKGGSGAQPGAQASGNYHPAAPLPNNSGALLNAAMGAAGGGAAGGGAGLLGSL